MSNRIKLLLDCKIWCANRP